MSRRDALIGGATAIASTAIAPMTMAQGTSDSKQEFQLRLTVASCMYGYVGIDEVLGELKKCGAQSVDLWPKVHGNQREQVDEMGIDRFQELLAKHKTRVDVISAYRFSIFELRQEIEFAQSISCPMLVTTAKGPRELTGPALRQAIAEFIEKLKPHLEVAAQHGVTLLIENHSGSMIDSIDAIRYLVDALPNDTVRFALAPAHLPQEASLLGDLVREIGGRLGFFYAWQYGKGFREKMQREDELLQMPGLGPLDFRPMIRSLREIRYDGLVEVMMHPTPRGVPIMPTTAEVTYQINQSHEYLRKLVS